MLFDNQPPKITVITPTFNAAKTLDDCIKSVIDQNYTPLEHWIIDGLSSDGTIDIVKNYALKYNHVQYISGKDKGIYDAMNKGIDLAGGEWVFFLGADDTLEPDVFNSIATQVNLKVYQLVYGKTKGKESSLLNGKKIDLNTIDEGLTIPHQASLIKKELFYKKGKYDLKYPVAADTHFFLKILGDPNIKHIFVDIIFASFGEAGFSSRQVDLIYNEDYISLVKKYLDITINPRAYWRRQSYVFFQQIYKGSLLQGIRKILYLAFKNNDWAFFIKNGLYWLRERLKNRIFK
jgi:glycosyltransferase involved in cell wall biosynthesis